MITPISKRDYLLAFLFAASVTSFWYLEPTTSARLGSFIFFVLISIYAFYNRRSDIMGVSILFFSLASINRYLFDYILPLWTVSLALVLLISLLWLILFRTQAWHYAILATLLAVELTLAFQYINTEIKLQTLFIIVPFALLAQYCYFQTNKQPL